MNDIKNRIAAHPIAQSLSDNALRVLMQGAREEKFEAGHLILRAHEPANSIYLIERGKVAIESQEAGGARPVQTIGAGELLGWSWLFPPFTWHLQARALERTAVIRLDGGHVLAVCETDHDVGYEIVKRMAQVLIQRLNAVISQNKA
jgi:CRP-like cAMP-binding protein